MFFHQSDRVFHTVCLLIDLFIISLKNYLAKFKRKINYFIYAILAYLQFWQSWILKYCS
jgi:hypothetical protein